jgi:hypothetical protein
MSNLNYYADNPNLLPSTLQKHFGSGIAHWLLTGQGAYEPLAPHNGIRV